MKAIEFGFVCVNLILSMATIEFNSLCDLRVFAVIGCLLRDLGGEGVGLFLLLIRSAGQAGAKLFDLFLELAHQDDQVGQSPHGGVFAEILAVR